MSLCLCVSVCLCVVYRFCKRQFQEAWFSAYAQDVDVMLWPSAYGGGMNMRAYAAQFGLRIVPTGIGDITDITGRVAEGHTCDCDKSWTDYGGQDNSGYCPGCQSPAACLCVSAPPVCLCLCLPLSLSPFPLSLVLACSWDYWYKH